MRLYLEKLGVTAAAGEEPSVSDGGRVLTELNDLNQRYMRLVTELHERLIHIKRVYDDAGLYFPVSLGVYSFYSSVVTALQGLALRSALLLRNLAVDQEWMMMMMGFFWLGSGI